MKHTSVKKEVKLDLKIRGKVTTKQGRDGVNQLILDAQHFMMLLNKKE